MFRGIAAGAAPGVRPRQRPRRVPRQPLDARPDLPEQNPCQAAFGKLQDEVSGMPNEAATGLEEPLLSVLWYLVSPTERDGSLLERRPAPAPGARGFERRRRPEHGEVGEAAADDLQAHREAGRRETGRNRGGRLAREVERVAERGPAEPVPSVLRPAGRVGPADGKRGDRGRRGQEQGILLEERAHRVPEGE